MNKNIKELTYQELQTWQAAQRTFELVDVRTEEERNHLHIGGTWVPMEDLNSHLCELPADRPIVVYCKRGIRSAIAIQRWQQKRPELSLYNLAGGLSKHFPQLLHTTPSADI